MKIIDIVKKFFKRLKSNKTIMIEERHIEEKTSNTIFYDTKRNIFAKSIYRNQRIELDDLQRKLENNQISINNINIFEVMDLIDKYQSQIIELKTKIVNF